MHTFSKVKQETQTILVTWKLPAEVDGQIPFKSWIKNFTCVFFGVEIWPKIWEFLDVINLIIYAHGWQTPEAASEKPIFLFWV